MNSVASGPAAAHKYKQQIRIWEWNVTPALPATRAEIIPHVKTVGWRRWWWELPALQSRNFGFIWCDLPPDCGKSWVPSRTMVTPVEPQWPPVEPFLPWYNLTSQHGSVWIQLQLASIVCVWFVHLFSLISREHFQSVSFLPIMKLSGTRAPPVGQGWN